MIKENFVIGVDYGTDSVRSVLVDTVDGKEIASSVFYYPRWAERKYCDPTAAQFRQHPLDYVEGLEQSIKACLLQAGPSSAAAVKAISIDTTGSTPIAVDRSGTPLALLPGFGNNPNAMFILWKDHTSVEEAAAINTHAKKFKTNYLQYVGGIYSSEWFWAKLLYILRTDEQVREACYSWVEHCDWIPFLLTGGQQAAEIKRSACAAGHKALWAESYGGFPPNDFFASLDPLLDGFTDRLSTQVYTADKPAGKISSEWADRLGLKEDVIIGVGAFDAHMGAVGGQIEPYHLSKVMGTSTCDMLIAPEEEVADIAVEGICGQVPGSIVPGMIGMEAGQSAFGDAYAWLKNILSWSLDLLEDKSLKQEISDKIIASLSAEASKLSFDEKDEIALDWLNGRRTPDANQLLKGAFANLNLGTDAPRMFKALVEATCFGAKAIVDRFQQQGIPIKGIIGLGGVAKKSSYVMQTMADVLNMPLRIHRSEQTCAAGAAMFAATVAGIYNTIEEAMQAMGQGFDKTFMPDKQKTSIHARRYEKYKMLGDHIEQLNAMAHNYESKKYDETSIVC